MAELSRPAVATVAWWCKSRDLSVAGIRIRAHLVMKLLRNAGLDVEWFQAREAARYRAVVVHARFDAGSQALVRRMRDAGCRVILDLCDDHFCNASSSQRRADAARDVRTMAGLADVVVVPTDSLARVIERECVLRAPPEVIPDLPDDMSDVRCSALVHSRAWFSAWRLKRRIAASTAQGRTALLWFGKCGKRGVEMGMADLARLREPLEQLDRRLPLHLTVLSDNRKRFHRLFRGWSFPVAYADWNAAHFADIAALHPIALIPVSDHPFTRGKSANRVVTALSHGMAVVADPLSSYQAFVDCILFGDWADSIERYARDEMLRQRHVELGRLAIRRMLDPAVMGDRWLRLLER
jgi:hypothetical protein